MKRLFSIFALAALMLLGMGGAANAKNITENVFEVGHTFSCKASKQDGGTEYGSLTFKVTQVGSTTTPGQVTLITFMSDWGDYSPSYWSGALWIPSYFTDPAGRKYVLTRIGDNVFQGGANISYIYFNYETDEMFDYVGNSVNFNIGNYSFAGCSKMTSVTKYSPTYRTGFTVANIGKYAFQNCSSLTMSMYSNIGGSIGEGAYENCSAMTTVNASGSISATAFKGCTAVKLINWHGGYSTKLTSGSESPMYPMRFSVTEIYITGAVPAYFFYNFTALTKVTSYTKFYDNLKNTNIYHMGVGEYGFGYCTSLQSIQVAGEINKYAFYGCNNLTSITYRGGYFAESQIPTSGSESFFNPVRSKITSFTFDETSTKTKPNTYIPAYICYGMTKLTKVTIPEYAKSIGKGAFQSCTSLETVTFSGTPTCSIIGEEAFDNCEKLSSITLPASVEYIYPEAFYYCRALTKCPISASNTNLKYIGTRAFYASKMTSFYVPESVKTLGQNLIDGSTGDTEITEITFMPKNLTRSNVGGSWANLFFDLGTVANRRKVTTFRVNSALTSIPDSLCYNFQGLEYVTDQNKSASLSSLVTIGKSSFQLCKALSGIIASNLTTIGDYAFAESAWGDDLGSNGWFNLKKIGQYAFSGSQITKIGTSVAYWPLPTGRCPP